MIEQMEYDIDDIDEFLKINLKAELEKGSLALQKILKVQHKISIIANIDVSDLRIILDKLQFLKYNYKDYIIKEGEVSQEIFFILSGECHVFSNNKKLGVLKAGTTFGEGAAIFKTPRNASVVCAVEGTTVLSFIINDEAIEFSAPAMVTLYKNLAFQINTKLEYMNSKSIKK